MKWFASHPPCFTYISLLEVEVYTPHNAARKFCLIAAFAALPLLISPEVRAQEPADEFTSLVQGAKVAYEGGNFPEAIRLLQRANMVVPNSRLLINIAKSYENLNDCVRALAYYKAYLRAPDAEESLAKIAKDALKSSKKCKDFNDNLSGRILVRTSVPEADVSLDGQPVGPAPLEMIALSPGPHKLHIELKGYTSRDEDFNAESNKETELTYTLEVPKVEIKPDPEKVKPDPDEIKDPGATVAKEDSSLNIPAIAILGAGVVVLGVGAIYDNVVIPGTDEERDKVARDSQEFSDLTDQRGTEATIAIAGYAIGGALILGGAGWLIYDMVAGGEKQEKKPSGAEGLVQDIRLTPIITPSTGGLLFEARF
jgi:hypothetical protein